MYITIHDLIVMYSIYYLDIYYCHNISGKSIIIKLNIIFKNTICNIGIGKTLMIVNVNILS